MSKKGVSLEDKRERMLKILHDSQTCWLLKDLEKAGAKKGVILQSVKEVVQGLVDDDLVNMDKVGQSNWFWAFPSEAGQKSRKRLEMLVADLDSLKKRRTDLDEKKQSAADSRTGSEDRTATLATLAQLEAKHQALSTELEQYKENDPQHFESLKQHTEEAHEAANRWTDNIFQLQKWCNDKFQGEPGKVKDGFKSLGVDLDTLDYIEE